ncbi:TrmH family RNA methyltransferase [Virgibacillus byunsanensis]|uniref:TrmH family RNA methyltransferase n=1 Tax=Virgibacillus byunsanensis TaxID=570945 RepID=A0ABW3LRD0_9BACI
MMIQDIMMGMKKMITSVKNEKIKDWKKLHKRKERVNSKTFLIEGFHLIEEAITSNWDVIEIILENDIELPNSCKDIPYTIVSDNVFQHIAQTKAPQGIAAVVQIQPPKRISGDNVLLVDAVQDPGNLGTIIRTADAAGFDAVVLGNDTVDLFNDKVIRATQGSLFHVPIMEADLITKTSELKEEGYRIWGAALENAYPFNEVTVDEKVALIVGNEGAGIQDELLRLVDTIVKIPIYGKAESLNVSVASGILMYYVKG